MDSNGIATTNRGKRRWWKWLALAVILSLFILTASVAVIFLSSRDRAMVVNDTPTETPLPAVATESELPEPEETSEADLVTLRPGRIAFIDPSGRLATVNPDGADERQLTTLEHGLFLFPAWSPTGERLAAIGANQDGAGVYAVDDSATGTLARLYFDSQEAPIYLYWSPDGERVSFIAEHPDGLGLYVAEADGATDEQLIATGQPFYWHWSSAGDEVLIHTGASSDSARLTFLGLTSADEDGNNLAQPGFFQAPGISSDGSAIGFSERDESGSRWLSIQELESGETVRTPHLGSVAMGWSPSAKEIAFISPVSEQQRSLLDFYGPLRIVDAETGEPRTLVRDIVLGFFWAPDGETIAYFTLARDPAEQTAHTVSELTFTSLSPPAQRERELRLKLAIVDVNSGASRDLLRFEPTRIFLAQFLPFFDQYALSHRLWSPDSSALVLPAVQEDKDQILIVPVDGTAPQTVADGSIAFWSQR